MNGTRTAPSSETRLITVTNRIPKPQAGEWKGRKKIKKLTENSLLIQVSC
jgi:hypothetical protein